MGVCCSQNEKQKKKKKKPTHFGYLLSSDYAKQEEIPIWLLQPTDSHFIPLQRFPFGMTAKYTINQDHKLLLIPETKIGSNDIFTFDIYYNKWVRHLHHDDEQTNGTDKMYVVIESNHSKGKLVQINVNGDKWNHSDKPITYACDNPQFVILNNQLHIITSNNQHYVWNDRRNKFTLRTRITTLDVKNFYNVHGIAYIKRKQCLYLFADLIYSYSLSDEASEWHPVAALSYTSFNVYNHICLAHDIVSICDDELIVFFCAETIYVFDVDNSVFWESDIRYPRPLEKLKASLIEDNHASPLLILGYFRDVLGIGFVPTEIATLIGLMFGADHSYIYLAEYCGEVQLDGNRQWLIDVEDIVTSRVHDMYPIDHDEDSSIQFSMDLDDRDSWTWREPPDDY
eukprot:695789_1